MSAKRSHGNYSLKSLSNLNIESFKEFSNKHTDVYQLKSKNEKQTKRPYQLSVDKKKRTLSKYMTHRSLYEPNSQINSPKKPAGQQMTTSRNSPKQCNRVHLKLNSQRKCRDCTKC